MLELEADQESLPSQVFISYAHEDGQLAGAIARGLQALGFLVWWDPEIRFGQSWRPTIRAALEGADCVIVLWSKHSVKSPFVCAEAEKARKRTVLVPLLLDDVELPLPFGEIQTADLTDWSGDTSDGPFPEIVKAVEEQAGPPFPLAQSATPTKRAKAADRDKLVILYDHADGSFLKRKGSSKVTDFVKFLEAIAPTVGLQVWWDEHRAHPSWDKSIEKIVDEARVVLLVVSIDFLRSTYVTNLRAQRAYLALPDLDVQTIAVNYKTIPGHPHGWLSQMRAVPTAGEKPLYRRSDKLEVYKELTDLIRRNLKGRVQPIKDPKATRTLRLVGGHSPAQTRALRDDACNRAFKFVPDSAVHDQICEAAVEMGAVQGGRPPLNTKQLADLDGRFLARKEKRDPDPKKIRWVLRCHDLHPQVKIQQKASRGRCP